MRDISILLTVDFAGIELEDAAGRNMIKHDRGAGLELLGKAAALGERAGGSKLQQIEVIIATGPLGLRHALRQRFGSHR